MTKARRLLLPTLAIAAVAWNGPPSQAQGAVTYQIVDLGTLGGPTSEAGGLNELGQVAGISETALGERRVFFWDNGTMTDVGTLGGDESFMIVPNFVHRPLNNHGEVIGWSLTAAGETHAFVWDAGTITDLGVLPGFADSFARSINDAGAIVGYNRSSLGLRRAFLWEPGLGLTDLGTLGGPASEAAAINEAGQVTGTTSSAADPREVLFLWETGVMDSRGGLGGSAISVADINEFGELTGTGRLASEDSRTFLWSTGFLRLLGTLDGGDCAGNAINNVGAQGTGGRIAGWCDTVSGFRPVLWENGAVNDLGSLGGSFGVAQDINESGQIVGRSRNAAGHDRAFLWEPGAGLIDLGTLGGLRSSAYDINESGWIAGWSENASGDMRATLWVPQPPAGNTPTGLDVAVTPVDDTVGDAPITVTFDEVTAGGDTTLTSSSAGPLPVDAYSLTTPNRFYDLTTSATSNGTATVCLDYSGLQPTLPEVNLVLVQYENGQWINRTSVGSPDTAHDVICGTVGTLGQFAVMEPIEGTTDFVPFPATILLSDTPATGDRLGFSVAVDGTTAVVGAYRVTVGGVVQAGAAYVYERDVPAAGGGHWALIRTLTAPVPQATDQFGWSVAISGTTAVVGARLREAPGIAGVNHGAAFVFDLTDSTAPPQELHAPDAGPGDAFGLSVAAAPGAVLVGAPMADGAAGNDSGRAYLYESSPGGWTFQAALGEGAVPNARFGWAVAVGDQLAAVGAPGGQLGVLLAAGTASVFDRTLPDAVTGWRHVGNVAGDLADPLSLFGYAVDTAGQSVVVGAPVSRGSSGSAFVYLRTSAPEPFRQTQVFPVINTLRFGQSVAMSGAGCGSNRGECTAVVGTGFGISQVHVFDRVADNVWGVDHGANGAPDQTQTLTSPRDDVDPTSAFGEAMALSGRDLILGAPFHDFDNPADGAGLVADRGAAFVFSQDPIPSLENTPPGDDVEVVEVATLPDGTPSHVQIQFDSVIQGGVTEVTASAGGPPPPTGFSFGQPPIIYDVRSTAVFGGFVQVCFEWRDGQFRDESTLTLFHHDAGGWTDITSSINTDDNVICGLTQSLSPFAIGEASYEFAGFLPPLLDDGSASVKQNKAGRTIPVKFQLIRMGAPTTEATATIQVFKVLDAASGTVDTTDMTEDSGASNDSGNSFRVSGSQYIFNLSTKGFDAPATYRIVVTLSDGESYSVDFSLR